MNPLDDVLDSITAHQSAMEADLAAIERQAEETIRQAGKEMGEAVGQFAREVKGGDRVEQ